MKSHNFSGNIAAFFAAALFGASVVATRVAVQKISNRSMPDRDPLNWHEPLDFDLNSS